MYRKILILRFSSIGDLVLTTPVIRCLKKQMNAEIHLLTKDSYKTVLLSNPYITKIWSFKNAVSDVFEELDKEDFDLIVDLHKNIRSYRISRLLKKKVIRFDKLNFQKWLVTVFKINVLPKKHLVDRYFDSLENLGIQNDGMGLDYFMNPVDKEYLNRLNLPNQYSVAVLGANHVTKQIPILKWREIINSINGPFVLVGGKDETEIAVQLQAEFPLKVISCVGTMSIAQSAAVIDASSQVITPDTGMMHIAAALKKPMHVIWGNTIPDFGMYPYFGNQKAIVKNHEVFGLSCRPCSKLGYSSCPKKHFNCMMQHSLNPHTLEF